MIKKSKIHSISIKIIMAITCIIILSSLINIISATNKSKETIEEVNKNYIESLAEETSTIIDSLPEDIQTTEEYSIIMHDIKMKNIDSSYAYLVDSDGKILYHPESDKIGKSVENEIIKNVVQSIESGNKLEDDVVEYDFDGITKYAGYTITDQNKIVVISADKDEVIQPINNMILQMIGTSVISIIVCIIIAYILGNFISKPIIQLTNVIKDTASLNFTHSDDKGLLNKKDEIGVMANEIHNMRENLRGIVSHIENIDTNIGSNMSNLETAAVQMGNMCTDNSATTEELAAGMEETAATTADINETVQNVKEKADEILLLTDESKNTSDEIMKRAVGLGEKTKQTSDQVSKLYHEIKTRSKKTIEDSKSVNKINELTESIRKIASQTSLLALNANIEAARAGESGKGFAIVATEIGNLAGKTAETIVDIENIVEVINNAVDDMINCINDTTNFLEKTVLEDYDDFGKVSEQYQTDATTFKQSMTKINESITLLTNLIMSTADALNGIKDTVSESAIGVTDIAEKTNGIVEQTNKTYDIMKTCLSCVDELKTIVDKFTIE